MAHWHNNDPLKQYIGNDTSVHVLNTSHDDGAVNALLQGERYEKQIRTQMPDGSPAASRLYPILAPTSLQFDAFLNACTNCGKCIEVCPEKILRPAQKEYEVYDIKDAQGKPTMSFEMGYCRPNCHRCEEVCPTGIIVKGERRKEEGGKTIRQVRLGWAQFNSLTCITQTDNVPCDACARHCPTKAIHLTEKNGQKIPRIHTHLCNGCGACEFYCPARPKAISVEGM